MGPIGVDPMKRIGWSSGACGMSSAIETIETKRGVMALLPAVTMTDMFQVALQVVGTSGQAAASGTLLGTPDQSW